MPETITHLEHLKQLREAQPFEPFVIGTKHGDNVVVTERMSFATNGVQMTVLDPRDRSKRLKVEDILKIRTIRELMQ